MNIQTEATDKYNKHLKTITESLYKLRTIEHCSGAITSEQVEKATQLFSSTRHLLEKCENFLLYRPLWEELHDRMVYYYDFQNTIQLSSKMPIFRITLHNEEVKWLLKCKYTAPLPIVHFDTHDDMDVPKSSKNLLTDNGKIDLVGINNGACGAINEPITTFILSKHTNHVVWATPEWVYDDDNGFDQYLSCKGNEILYLRDKKQPIDKYIYSDNVKIIDESSLINQNLNFCIQLDLIDCMSII